MSSTNLPRPRTSRASSLRLMRLADPVAGLAMALSLPWVPGAGAEAPSLFVSLFAELTLASNGSVGFHFTVG